jgi:hypothetical protein
VRIQSGSANVFRPEAMWSQNNGRILSMPTFAARSKGSILSICDHTCATAKILLGGVERRVAVFGRGAVYRLLRLYICFCHNSRQYVHLVRFANVHTKQVCSHFTTKMQSGSRPRAYARAISALQALIISPSPLLTEERSDCQSVHCIDLNKLS